VLAAHLLHEVGAARLVAARDPHGLAQVLLQKTQHAAELRVAGCLADGAMKVEVLADRVAASVRRKPASCTRVMRCAASAAISPSSTRRSSTTCTTASSDSSTVGSNASAWCGDGSATYTPEPWRERSKPRDLIWCTASRTTERDTPWAAASWASVGKRSPGRSEPPSICCIKRRASRSDSRSATSGSTPRDAEARAVTRAGAVGMVVRLSDNFR
jgi:hypothetical protein